MVKIFTREKRNYYKVPGQEFIIIHSKIIYRGGQRIQVKKSGPPNILETDDYIIIGTNLLS
jgi:hypothetical protein